MLTPVLIKDLEISPFNFIRQDEDILFVDVEDTSGFVTSKANLSLPNVSSLFSPIDLSITGLPSPVGIRVPLENGGTQLVPSGNCYFVVSPIYGYTSEYLNNGLPVNLLSGNILVDNGPPMTGHSYSVLNQNLAFYNNLSMSTSNSYLNSINSNQLGVEMTFSQNTIFGFNLVLPRFVSGEYGQTLRFFNSDESKIFKYQSSLSPVIPGSLRLTLQVKDINNIIYSTVLVDNGLGKFIEEDRYNIVKNSSIQYQSNDGKLYVEVLLNSMFILDTQSLNTLDFRYSYDANMLYNRSEIPFYIKNNTNNLLVVSSEDSFIDSPSVKSIYCQPNQMISMYPVLSRNSPNVPNSFWSSSTV